MLPTLPLEGGEQGDAAEEMYLTKCGGCQG